MREFKLTCALCSRGTLQHLSLLDLKPSEYSDIPVPSMVSSQHVSQSEHMHAASIYPAWNLNSINDLKSIAHFSSISRPFAFKAMHVAKPISCANILSVVLSGTILCSSCLSYLGGSQLGRVLPSLEPICQVSSYL